MEGRGIVCCDFAIALPLHGLCNQRISKDMIIIELLDLPILRVESEEFGVRHQACRVASVLDQLKVQHEYQVTEA